MAIAPYREDLDFALVAGGLLGSLNLLMADLHKRGIVTKVRTLKTGETLGGIPFTRGPLAHAPTPHQLSKRVASTLFTKRNTALTESKMNRASGTVVVSAQ